MVATATSDISDSFRKVLKRGRDLRRGDGPFGTRPSWIPNRTEERKRLAPVDITLSPQTKATLLGDDFTAFTTSRALYQEKLRLVDWLLGTGYAVHHVGYWEVDGNGLTSILRFKVTPPADVGAAPPQEPTQPPVVATTATPTDSTGQAHL